MKDEMHPCPDDWRWWASYDGGEHMAVGPAETRSELVAMLKVDRGGEYQAEDGTWRIKAYIGEFRENHQDLAGWFEADRFIEDTADRMDECDCGSDENGEQHPLGNISKEQEADLEASVRAAIREWQKRHMLKLRFYWFAERRNEEHLDIVHPGASS